MTNTTRLKPRPKTPRNSSVTIMRGDQFNIRFSEAAPSLAMNPQLLAKIVETATAAPMQPDRDSIIAALGLDPEVIVAVDKIARENDLTFGEAINYHLMMTTL